VASKHPKKLRGRGGGQFTTALGGREKTDSIFPKIFLGQRSNAIRGMGHSPISGPGARKRDEEGRALLREKWGICAVPAKQTWRPLRTPPWATTRPDFRGDMLHPGNYRNASENKKKHQVHQKVSGGFRRPLPQAYGQRGASRKRGASSLEIKRKWGEGRRRLLQGNLQISSKLKFFTSGAKASPGPVNDPGSVASAFQQAGLRIYKDKKPRQLGPTKVLGGLGRMWRRFQFLPPSRVVMKRKNVDARYRGAWAVKVLAKNIYLIRKVHPCHALGK